MREGAKILQGRDRRSNAARDGRGAKEEKKKNEKGLHDQN